MTDKPEASTRMLRRVAAAQATLDAFDGEAFRWGERDCARLAASHLRRLGYKVKLPPKGAYRTLRGALVQLRRLGHADIGAAIDALGLERIAPAAAVVGDLMMGGSEDGLGAVGVCLGNGRLCGFHPELGRAAKLQPRLEQMTAAWRAEPR